MQRLMALWLFFACTVPFVIVAYYAPKLWSTNFVKYNALKFTGLKVTMALLIWFHFPHTMPRFLWNCLFGLLQYSTIYLTNSKHCSAVCTIFMLIRMWLCCILTLQADCSAWCTVHLNTNWLVFSFQPVLYRIYGMMSYLLVWINDFQWGTAWKVSRTSKRLRKQWRWLQHQSFVLFKQELRIHVVYGSHSQLFLGMLLVCLSHHVISYTMLILASIV